MLEKLTQLIREYKADDSIVVTEDMSLVGDLGLSSLDLIQLGVLIEEELHIHFPDRALKDIRTVGDVVMLAEKLK